MRNEKLKAVKSMVDGLTLSNGITFNVTKIIPDITSKYVEEALNQTPCCLITDGDSAPDQIGSDGAYFLTLKIYLIVIMEFIRSGNDDDFRTILDDLRELFGDSFDYVFVGTKKGMIEDRYMYGVIEINYQSEVQ